MVVKNKLALGGFSLLLSAVLLLTGCSSPAAPETSPTDETGSPTDTNGLGGDSSVLSEAALRYSQNWGESKVPELLFPLGEYSFAYRENNVTKDIPTWEGSGVIGFYKDGTCSFDFSGEKISYLGDISSYRIAKLNNGHPIIKIDGSEFWNNDQQYIETQFRTNFPSMGAFPREQNLSSFCSLQMLDTIGSPGNASFGFFRWDIDEGLKFAQSGKNWFIDYNLYALEIENENIDEAIEILNSIYYGNENIFTFTGEGKVDLKDNGTVFITTGIEGESDIFSEFILTPVEKPISISVVDEGEPAPPTLSETAAGNILYSGSGILYLRDVKKLFEEFTPGE
jgi:hypothetical protein